MDAERVYVNFMIFLYHHCLLLLVLFSCLFLVPNSPPLAPCNSGGEFLVYQQSPLHTFCRAVCSPCYFHPVTSLTYFTASHIKIWTISFGFPFWGLLLPSTTLAAGKLTNFVACCNERGAPDLLLALPRGNLEHWILGQNLTSEGFIRPNRSNKMHLVSNFLL